MKQRLAVGGVDRANGKESLLVALGRHVLAARTHAVFIHIDCLPCRTP